MAGSRALGDPRVPPPPPKQDGCVRLLDPGSVPRDCCPASITADRLGLRRGGRDARPKLSCLLTPPTPPQPLRGSGGQQVPGCSQGATGVSRQVGAARAGFLGRGDGMNIVGSSKNVSIGLKGSREL